MTMFKEKPLADVLAPQVDGYYEIRNPANFMHFRAVAGKSNNKANAKLMNDVDMASVTELQPIPGTYGGTFDGQGFTLKNVNITHYGDMHTALFYELQNATVKNLKLTGEYHSDQQRMGGLAAWTSGTTKIENCEIAVALYSEKEGDGTHGGIMAVHGRGGNCTVSNCIVACKFIGQNTHSVGGVCGWRDATLNITNTLILSEYDLAPEPTSYPTCIVSRNGYTDGGNVFYAQQAEREGATKQGTLASNGQLASGEICFKLNGGAEIPVWYQTLGEDAYPVLDKTHLEVLYDENKGYYNWSDDPNGIENVNVNDNVNKVGIYNLAGQRLSRMQKGINIVGGKKILY